MDTSKVFLAGLFREVHAVIVTFDVFEDGFHLLGLSLPLILAHLRLTTK